ncbi:MAG: dTDP-4-dehydrorhamnose 3,5-epimerase family protein [Bacteroidota bacterium]
MFKKGTIQGVLVRPLPKYLDDRGWLTEVFRSDELEERFLPAMGYISVTEPGIARGPHEHVEQADHFCFLGPSNFKVYLWDNRKDSSTYLTRQVIYAGEDAPRAVIIPPGVVHAYRNIGGRPGMVVNNPNRLYGGKGKKEPVDEVRHEDDPATMFRLD